MSERPVGQADIYYWLKRASVEDIKQACEAELREHYLTRNMMFVFACREEIARRASVAPKTHPQKPE